jgi:HEAT repeat protein
MRHEVEPLVEPLVSGKSVAYWLDTLPPEASYALLPADNPLVRAGPETVPSLIAAINQSYASRSFAYRCRSILPPFLRKYLPRLHTPGWQIRQAAAFRLGLMGSGASNAVPTLVGLLNKESTYVGDKGRVIQALGNIGPPARQAVPVLVENLNDQSEWIRMTSVYSLLQIGAVPPEAIPALKRNLSDTGYVSASMAVALLAGQQTPESLSRVESMLTEKGERDTQALVAAGLGLLSEVPDELKPILTRMMDEDDASVRQGAAIALARPHAENLHRIVQILVEGLQRGQFQVRCAQALGKIGPDAAAARAGLEHAQGYVLGIAARDALAKVSAVSIEPDGPANGSQPIPSETNRASSAAGSRR